MALDIPTRTTGHLLRQVLALPILLSLLAMAGAQEEEDLGDDMINPELSALIDPAWSTGTKRVIIIRVDFPDRKGDPFTLAEATTSLSVVRGAYTVWSFGQLDLLPVRNDGSVVTNVYELPEPWQYYDSPGTGAGRMREHAHALAANDHDLSQFQLDVVGFSAPFTHPDVEPKRGGGLGTVGGPAIWMNDGIDPYVLAHEIGHNLGMAHANRWRQVFGESIFESGENIEYGDSYDIMGRGPFEIPRLHPNPFWKHHLGWLSEDRIWTVTSSGTYRLHQANVSTLEDDRRYALRIARDQRDYWGEFRQLGFEEERLNNGLLLRWSPWRQSNHGTHLLDFTPPAEGMDVPLVLGQTLSDFDNGIHITPFARMGLPASLDVVVNIGDFPDNHAPDVTLTASARRVRPGVSVTFTAEATDEDGDPLVYHWRSGEELRPNARSFSRTYRRIGLHTVNVTVSDMKGGATTRTITVYVDADPRPRLRVDTIEQFAREDGSARGIVRIQRATDDVVGELRVPLLHTGTATAGVDYEAPEVVIIPEGTSVATYTVTPLQDQDVEPTETVIAEPAFSLDYIVDFTFPRTVVSIADDDAIPGRGIRREVWTRITGSEVVDLTGHAFFPDLPSDRTIEPRFEAPPNFDDHYGTRMRGYLVPTITGRYDFWIAANDTAELYLSTDDVLANRRRIATVTTATDPREWTLSPTQHASGIPLVAGQRYYIEALHKESIIGDHLAVAWAPTGGQPAVIEGDFLQPYLGIIGTGTGLTGIYFHNVDLTEPALTRLDPFVDVNWGTGSPDPAIDPETFSVRWRGQIQAEFTEDYTFITFSDDGVRVWIDGRLVIDNWTDHPLTRDASQPIPLVAGQRYDIAVEFYENTVDAAVHLRWSSPSTQERPVPTTSLYPDPGTVPFLGGTGLAATYFDRPDLTLPVYSRIDENIDFNFGSGSPDPFIAPRLFSVSWKGFLQAPVSGTYTLITQSDDGIRVYLDGNLIIDNWTDHGLTEDRAVVDLEAERQYDIVVEYYERHGTAVVRLLWESDAIPRQPIPTESLYPAAIIGTGSGLSATYFDAPDFSGSSIDRLDPFLDFDWPTGQPDPALEPETFSVRWSGRLRAEFTERYTLITVASGQVRLLLDGQLLIDQPAGEASASIDLEAGRFYDVEIELNHDVGPAHFELLWESLSTVRQTVPTSSLYPRARIGEGSGLLAAYYDRLEFSGESVLRLDPTIAFRWFGRPHQDIDRDTFSTRWSGQLQPEFTETYTITTISDDGIRVRLNGELIIDNWTDHPLAFDSAMVELIAGQRYDLVVEHYENTGEAIAFLLWSSPSTPRTIIPSTSLYPAPGIGTGTGLLAQYFDDGDLELPIFGRIDPLIDFDWDGGSPDPTIAPDTFSVRWVGRIQAQFSETYTFSTVTDDGVRLWIDGQPLIDDWNVHGPTLNRGTIALQAGEYYDVVMEYFEHFGLAEVELMWSSPSTRRVTVPTSQLYPVPTSLAQVEPAQPRTALAFASLSMPSITAWPTAPHSMHMPIPQH